MLEFKKKNMHSIEPIEAHNLKALATLRKKIDYMQIIEENDFTPYSLPSQTNDNYPIDSQQTMMTILDGQFGAPIDDRSLMNMRSSYHIIRNITNPYKTDDQMELKDYVKITEQPHFKYGKDN